MAIKTFADANTEKLFNRLRVKVWGPEIQKVGLRKLVILHAAANLYDLRVPPGNRLEALSGNRAGQHSIRINDQWRICFRWVDGDAYDVEIVDYH